MKYVVKQNARSEIYDTKKLYASIYRSCLACDYKHTQASSTAERVTQSVRQWMSNKAEVSTRDIKTQAHKELVKINKQAGYLYAHHRIIA